MASEDSQTELRLVLLGRAGAGQSSAGSTILGLQGFTSQHAAGDAVIQECQKHRGEVAGRKVAVVTTPDWFSSGCNPEEVRRHISSFVAFSTPGPHAFLLCVPANQPVDGEPEALEALEKLFGPSAVSGHAIVLLTHTDELDEGGQLDQHLITQHKDLLELVERCGDRFHVLRRGSGEEERKAVEELLEKVDQAVRESGTEHFSCPLYQEAEERVRQRQEEIVRQDRGQSGMEEEVDGQDDRSAPHLKEDIDDRDMERAREEAERSINDLDVDNIIPSTSVAASQHPPSFLWGLWEMLTGWMRRVPKFVRREALLGSLLGLFLGGPFGGMLGATVGSIATEVGRRKTQKNK